MTKIHRRASFFGALLVLAALTSWTASSAEASPGETLDQQFETPADFNDWNGIYYLPEDVQTFTAGSAGTLTTVQLELYKIGMTLVNNLRLKVFPTDSNGKPLIDGVPLAVTTSAGSALTDTKQWVSFTFHTAANLTSGTRYALALTLDGEGDLEENPHWSAFSRAGNTFPSGQSCVDSIPQGSPHEFLCNDSSDLGFRTFMSSPDQGTVENSSGTTSDDPNQLPNTGVNIAITQIVAGFAVLLVAAGSFIAWRRRLRR